MAAEAPAPAPAPVPDPTARPLALRVGVILFVVSWLPIPWLFGIDGGGRAAIWTVQVIIGLIGLAIAGREFVALIKSYGRRRAPKAMWNALIHGRPA